ncbi:MAG: hypothetical protein WCP32_18470 [Bacteroidota bacterium]
MKLVTITVLICFLAFSTVAQSTFRKGFTGIGFIENKGQIIDQDNKPNPSVLYLLNTPGMNVQLSGGVFYSGASWNFMDFTTIFWASTPSGQDKAISHGINAENYSVSLYPPARGMRLRRGV